MPFLFADAGLARKLEAAEAVGGQAMVEALRGRQCGSAEIAEAAAVEPAGGGVAVFCGAGSTLTRAHAVGITQPVAAADLDRLEEFFLRRGAPPAIDICPFSDPGLVELLARRHYRPVEFSNALSCLIEPNDSRPLLEPCADRELWARVMLEGAVERTGLSEEELEAGRLVFDCSAAYLGELDGQFVAAGALAIRGDVAVFLADSTLPGFRRRSAHLRLIWGRLRTALEAGVTIATATTAPGSGSQRNYERCGFRVAYTRTLMVRDE